MVPELDTQLAARQHGLVRHDQLRGLGLSDSGIRKRVSRGRLIRVRRGVYAVGYAPLTSPAQWLAAVWTCGPEALLSHRAAAALWDIRRASLAVIDVTVPVTAGRATRERIRLHRTQRRPEADEREGIPVTTWARTVLDTASTLDDRGVELILERSEQLRIFDRTALERTLAHHAGRPGCAGLRRVMDAANLGATLTKNELEEAMFRLCDGAGLPRPEVNQWIGGYQPDFLWRDQMLIAETDGWETHGTRAAFESDRLRDAELMMLGYRIVRFSYWRVLRHENAIAWTLARLLTSGA